MDRRYTAANEKLEQLRQAKQDREREAEVIVAFMEELASRDGVLEAFDDKLWLVSIEKAVVHRDGQIVFHFYGGTTVIK